MEHILSQLKYGSQFQNNQCELPVKYGAPCDNPRAYRSRVDPGCQMVRQGLYLPAMNVQPYLKQRAGTCRSAARAPSVPSWPPCSPAALAFATAAPPRQALRPASCPLLRQVTYWLNAVAARPASPAASPRHIFKWCTPYPQAHDES